MLTECDHTRREVRSIEPDGRTIKLASPMASTKTVRLFRNGDEVVQDDPLYGWESVLDRDETADYRVDPEPRVLYDRRSIQLKQTTKILDDEWIVKYITDSGSCPKCAGLSIISDWELDDAGRAVTVVDEVLLEQILRKIALTDIESHPEHLWYGTTLKSSISDKITSRRNPLSIAALQTGLQKIQSVQQQQKAFQNLSSGEMIRRILNVDFVQGTGDAVDTFFVRISVESMAKQRVVIDQFLTA